MGMMSMYMCYICMDDSDVLNSQDKKKTKLKVKKKKKQHSSLDMNCQTEKEDGRKGSRFA